MDKVCLVIGAGAGIGGTVAKRFAKEGYYSYLARRTDEEGLDKLIKEISDAGGKASGSLLNVIEENSIEDLVNKIESEIGPIDTVIYNIGAQIGDRALADTSYKAFEMGSAKHMYVDEARKSSQEGGSKQVDKAAGRQRRGTDFAGAPARAVGAHASRSDPSSALAALESVPRFYPIPGVIELRYTVTRF